MQVTTAIDELPTRVPSTSTASSPPQTLSHASPERPPEFLERPPEFRYVARPSRQHLPSTATAPGGQDAW